MKYADVAIPVPLQDSYTYSVPKEMEQEVCVGSLVNVCFGKSKTYIGMVARLHSVKPQGFEVKPIKEVVCPSPVATQRQMEFWQWISHYYACPFGEVYNTAVPAKMKAPLSARVSKSKQSQMLRPLIDVSDGMMDDVCLSPLSPAQQSAHDSILTSFKEKDITLLHGVTSSGKTEIYIHLIYKYVREGKQVLYLLPEIALTTQITDRLAQVFGDDMGVYHSMFTDVQRAKVYRRQLSSEPYKLILGVRSSVFLPFDNLGLVIVDEEHETSYKQQDPAPRYHARAAAVMLARLSGAKTLLGTATPSVETYHLAQTGRYGYVRLAERFGGVNLPQVEVVDTARLRFQRRMKGAFSPVLLDAIGDALSQHQQVILFHNRRGYSSLVECKACGWVPRCAHCDVSLTYHKSNNLLVCHYCGKSYSLPTQCPACEQHEFVKKGSGTERVEDQIARHFPDARILRMDTDTAHTRAAYEQIITDFSERKYDILIGTQMVTKGLDFGGVTLVGILDADVMLNQPDFRSFERTFHILTQVAGRAGRKDGQGRVILQTKRADSDIIRQVVTGDYASMFAQQMEERRLFNYPPFHRLIYVYMKHLDASRLEPLSQQMAQLLTDAFGVSCILGPARPPVSRIQSMHIRQFIIKVAPRLSTAAVRQQLATIRTQMLTAPSTSGLIIYYDVDPM
ncbi:MAG: primosomal protein N' [Prevotellaceae bacterium]|nr:primosomal protein N' [Candidatus Colivivens caballi]